MPATRNTTYGGHIARHTTHTGSRQHGATLAGLADMPTRDFAGAVLRRTKHMLCACPSPQHYCTAPRQGCTSYAPTHTTGNYARPRGGAPHTPANRAAPKPPSQPSVSIIGQTLRSDKWTVHGSIQHMGACARGNLESPVGMLQGLQHTRRGR